MRKLFLSLAMICMCACQAQAPQTCEVKESPHVYAQEFDPFWWTKVDRHAIKDKMVVYHPEEDYLAP